MGRLSTCLDGLRERGECALIPFLTAGDPDLETTEAVLLAMVEAGADVIEIGVPFSDPIGEGPVIQRASERSLAAGVTLRRILELVRRVRSKVDTPLVLMGYANPVFAMGADNFARVAAGVGVDAVIVADLPPEAGREVYAACRDAGVDPILLAAPTTTPERLKLLVNQTSGFLYYVSLTGVTGIRSELSQGIEEAVAQARTFGDVPVCVGFGISTPEQAREVSAYADGVVVGSAIVKRIEDAVSPADAVEDVRGFIGELKQALRGHS